MLKTLFFGNLSWDQVPFDNPLIMIFGGGTIVLFLTLIGGSLTYFKKWTVLWREWITTVDHKKIGIMYILLSLMMLLRGFIDAAMMRMHLALSAGGSHGFLPPEHYDQIFTAHGVIMIFFVAMPLMFGLFNAIIPIQIGARDVAYPYLNSLCFWLTFMATCLVNISLVLGKFSATGWLAYPPLSGIQYSPGVGVDYYIWAVQISGVGSLLSAINFIATILKMRCPGMTLMKMPVFVWSCLCSSILMALVFPMLTVSLALLSFDRMLDMHFFTQGMGGNVMMYLNLIWAWGHPEVYILVLPAFGIYSELVATFSKKRLFGYTTMVFAIAVITFLSFIVWAHHFFTMGAGANVNAFFGIATMIIAVPTGVKVFNWLFTMYRGRIDFKTPMLWTMAFFTTFSIGGMTGVLMAIPTVDFQTHNSLFLVAHFHNTAIGAIVFGYFAGLIYWFPKMFGFKLDELWGRYAVGFWVSGFFVAFMPLYALGLMGVMRRINHYDNLVYQPYFIVAAIGTVLILLGVVCQVIQLIVSIKKRHELRDQTGDPWDGRTLEWTTPSPAPMYNFAQIPTVSELDDFWEKKQQWNKGEKPAEPREQEDIHMPKNTADGFFIALFSAVLCFALVWHMWIPGIIGLFGTLFVMVARTFNTQTDYYIKARDVLDVEQSYIKGEGV
ncbi:MAG TPA: cytochrome o ubiquinol oxidase subunit I [Gammaproteobacteria bacterium]|nr:cytochrome o ubiquinol oxidase subunit I [Gammaproteobacteria bacterium]